MLPSGISHELAKRIALAVRMLPDADGVGLMHALVKCTGLPLTEEAVARVTVAQLREQAGADLGDEAAVRAALCCLRGDYDLEETPADVPQPHPLAPGEMAGSIRAACASNTSAMVDGHFGSCARFLIYQVSPDEVRLIDVRPARGVTEGEDKNAQRVALIADCHLLCVASIGGPAAAKVVNASIHPIKIPDVTPAAEVLGRLQSVLAGSPPPWLAKAMAARRELTVS